MNRWLLGAGVLGLATALMHWVGGGMTILRAFLESPIPPAVRATFYAAWHLITLALFTSAAALLAAAHARRGWASALARFLGAQYLCFGAIVLAVGLLGRDAVGPWALAQWALFFPIGALALEGARRAAKADAPGGEPPSRSRAG